MKGKQLIWILENQRFSVPTKRFAFLMVFALVLLASSVFAFSNEPTDYIFWDSGDIKYFNGGYTVPADGDALTSHGYTTSTTSAVYDDDTVKIGNMSIYLPSGDIGNKFNFGACTDCTLQFAFYDTSGGTSFDRIQPNDDAGNWIGSLYTNTPGSQNYFVTHYGGNTTDLGIARATGWHNWTYYMSPSAVYFEVYIDGTLVYNDTTARANMGEVYFMSHPSYGLYYNLDYIMLWEGTPEDQPQPAGADSTPPEIDFYNMTSEGGAGCINWNTDKTNPCVTNDTTPTVFFNTSENAFCAIGISDSSYTVLGSSKNCTGGEGTMEHTCDLTTQDIITEKNSNIYISCKDESDNENATSSSGALAIEIHAIETEGENAIGIGVQNALLDTYTNYTSQQVSARDLSDNQFLGTFDWVAKKASKIWAFNYISSGESHVAGTFNLTPVLYVLQLTNTTQQQVTLLVETMINDTK